MFFLQQHHEKPWTGPGFTKVPLASKAIQSLCLWRTKIISSAPLCGADAWFLSPIWMWADPKPQQQGPHPVCCLCTFTSSSVFGVRGETFYITGEEEHEWSHCWLVFMLIYSGPWVPPRPPSRQTPILITQSLSIPSYHFIIFNQSVKFCTSVFVFFFILYYFFGSQEVRGRAGELWSVGTIWEHE